MNFCLSCRAVEYEHNALIIAYSLPFIQLSLFSKQLPLIVSNLCELGATQYNQVLLFQQHVIIMRIRLHTISEHWTVNTQVHRFNFKNVFILFSKGSRAQLIPHVTFCVYLHCQSVFAWEIWRKRRPGAIQYFLNVNRCGKPFCRCQYLVNMCSRCKPCQVVLGEGDRAHIGEGEGG